MHIVDVLLLYFIRPDNYLISSVNDFGDSVDDLSIAWFVIKNPNIIAPTNLMPKDIEKFGVKIFSKTCTSHQYKGKLPFLFLRVFA